jgi:hypothetical protein
MFDENIATFSEAPELLNLVGATVLVERTDFTGIHHAGRSLAEDFGRVTRSNANPFQLFEPTSASETIPRTAILIGCLDSCRSIGQLESSGKIDTSSIRGKWETFLTAVVDNPFEGCERALLIAGSDKRGAIFGAYTLSSQIGVSPYTNPIPFSNFTADFSAGIGGPMYLQNIAPRSSLHPFKRSTANQVSNTGESSSTMKHQH